MVAKDNEREADSVLRIIRERPGLSAGAIGLTLGLGTSPDAAARLVRGRIAELRARGERIAVAPEGGYYDLSTVRDGRRAAELAQYHVARTRAYMRDHLRLLVQIGGMTVEEVAERMLFDLTVGDQDGEADMVGPDDLERMPDKRRAGYFRALFHVLERIQQTPEAFASERVEMARRFGKVFITGVELQKLAQARQLLNEIAE
jgi:hypothetical protein